MAQLGLDKTAEEFRVLHHERQVAIGKWQEATDLIAKRDEELQAIFNNVRVNDVTKVLTIFWTSQYPILYLDIRYDKF
jgi:hypothetical protein